MNSCKQVLKQVCVKHNWTYEEYNDNIVSLDNGSIIVFWLGDGETNVQFVSNLLLPDILGKVVLPLYKDPLKHFNFKLQDNILCGLTAFSSSLFYGNNAIEYVADDLENLRSEFMTHVKIINKIIDSL